MFVEDETMQAVQERLDEETDKVVFFVFCMFI